MKCEMGTFQRQPIIMLIWIYLFYKEFAGAEIDFVVWLGLVEETGPGMRPHSSCKQRNYNPWLT